METIKQETSKKASMRLTIGKAASYYIKHFDELNKDTDPFSYINSYYNPFIRL